jgi:uncharacterized repeat protein (TIGR03803 family)
LEPGGNSFTVLRDLDGADGRSPYERLVLGANGALSGSTLRGGFHGYGTLFRITTDGAGFTTLFDPDEFAGADSYVRLFWGIDGQLYGSTWGGGNNGTGTVFRLLKATRPVIDGVSPGSVLSGSGPATLLVTGSGFATGSIVRWDGTDLPTSFVSETEVLAEVASVPATSDILTALITVCNPDGTVSAPVVFQVLAANVSSASSAVAEAGGTASVSLAPTGGRATLRLGRGTGQLG